MHVCALNISRALPDRDCRHISVTFIVVVCQETVMTAAAFGREECGWQRNLRNPAQPASRVESIHLAQYNEREWMGFGITSYEQNGNCIQRSGREANKQLFPASNSHDGREGIIRGRNEC